MLLRCFTSEPGAKTPMSLGGELMLRDANKILLSGANQSEKRRGWS